jgi:CO/xanthine dehydrogenase Mo-binding subunit
MAAAIANAVANALNGVRVRDLPIKPDKIVSALHAQKKNELT